MYVILRGQTSITVLVLDEVIAIKPSKNRCKNTTVCSYIIKPTRFEKSFKKALAIIYGSQQKVRKQVVSKYIYVASYIRMYHLPASNLLLHVFA